jgi:hypothetical protein
MTEQDRFWPDGARLAVASFDFPGFNPAAYEQQLTDEFDQLHAEGASRRRMMVIGLHERRPGHAARGESWTGSSPGSATTPTCGGPLKTRSPSGSSASPAPAPGSTAPRVGQRHVGRSA